MAKGKIHTYIIMRFTKAKILIFLISIFFSFCFFHQVLAREFISDWYIQNFETEIVVNKDSSLLVTEKITADCDDLPNKHGIFRVLPVEVRGADDKYIKVPIKLISITDFNDRPLKYKTIKDYSRKTITWKIGDPYKTVKGINHYKIVYRVKNVISFVNPTYDELYWNLLGNFWELEIDNFIGRIIFPKEVNQKNVKVDYYTGYLDSKDKSLADYRWVADNILEFYSTRPLKKRQGITVSVLFPKNIFSPSKLTPIEKYGARLWYLLPLFVFLICFCLWFKYGKDPHARKVIIPQFEPPENLSPIETGLLISDGRFENKYLTASIINLAVKGFIKIKEIGKKEFFIFKKKDFLFKKTEKEYKNEELGPVELLVLKSFFPDFTKEVLLSSLKNKFSDKVNKIKKKAIEELIKKKLIFKKSLSLKRLFRVTGIIIWIFWYFADNFSIFPTSASSISFISSALIIILFSFFMPKRTKKGAELLWRIKGFKLYMDTAERYRQRFYEKENIFERFLPYAIVFGIAKRWVQKIKEIYGEKYFTTYAPAWYVGASKGFDSENFNSTIEHISSGIAASIGKSSGFGGGGAGGGSGGGGGGGW